VVTRSGAWPTADFAERKKARAVHSGRSGTAAEPQATQSIVCPRADGLEAYQRPPGRPNGPLARVLTEPNHLGIRSVVLLPLNEWLDVSGRDQPHRVAQTADLAPLK
jgi:hypothetical protein